MIQRIQYSYRLSAVQLRPCIALHAVKVDICILNARGKRVQIRLGKVKKKEQSIQGSGPASRPGTCGRFVDHCRTVSNFVFLMLGK
jgi:hypothetical protein